MGHCTWIVAALLVGCGGNGNSSGADGNGTGGDAPQQPSDAPEQNDASIDAPDAAPGSITISGVANARSAGGTAPVSGAAISAYLTTNETTALATTTTDGQGRFMLAFYTGQVTFDGFLKATKTGYVDSYVYPAAPFALNSTGVPVNMVTTGNFGLLSYVASGNQMAGKGLVAILVLDGPQATGSPLAGATVSTTPAASAYRYNSGGLPSSSATSTDTDGIGYGFNVDPVAPITVTAAKTGSTFASHLVKARADSLTTTAVTP